ATVIAAFLASALGGLHRLTINARRTRRRLPSRFPPDPLPQDRQHLGPCPVIAPLGEIVIPAAFGQHVMREHLPLAATAVQIQERVESLPHVEFPGATTPVAAGRRNQGLHDRPLFVREIRRVRLPGWLLPRHAGALPYSPPVCATLLRSLLSIPVSGEPL